LKILKESLKKMGEKIAETEVIDARTPPRFFYQPKPPAKIQEKMDKLNKGL